MKRCGHGEFQRVGAATRKALSPKVRSLVLGMEREPSEECGGSLLDARARRDLSVRREEFVLDAGLEREPVEVMCCEGLARVRTLAAEFCTSVQDIVWYTGQDSITRIHQVLKAWMRVSANRARRLCKFQLFTLQGVTCSDTAWKKEHGQVSVLTESGPKDHLFKPMVTIIRIKCKYMRRKTGLTLMDHSSSRWERGLDWWTAEAAGGLFTIVMSICSGLSFSWIVNECSKLLSDSTLCTARCGNNNNWFI